MKKEKIFLRRSKEKLRLHNRIRGSQTGVKKDNSRVARTNLLPCETLADDLRVLIDVEVLSCSCITVSNYTVLHWRVEKQEEKQHKRSVVRWTHKLNSFIKILHVHHLENILVLCIKLIINSCIITSQKGQNVIKCHFCSTFQIYQVSYISQSIVIKHLHSSLMTFGVLAAISCTVAEQHYLLSPDLTTTFYRKCVRKHSCELKGTHLNSCLSCIDLQFSNNCRN